MAVLAERRGERLRPGRDEALTATARIVGQRVTLVFPTTYMNESGRSVGRLVARSGLDDLARLVVVHDELDLPPGRLKVKVGGGLAGHNGLRSIDAHLRSKEFVRVRIGVGKPPGGAERGAAHVLRPVRGTDRELLAEAVERAADAVESIVAEGVDATMATVNARPD